MTARLDNRLAWLLFSKTSLQQTSDWHWTVVDQFGTPVGQIKSESGRYRAYTLDDEYEGFSSTKINEVQAWVTGHGPPRD